MKELTDFLQIISDETRLRILVLLSEGELCVCEMCAVLGESQPKISRHLAKLRDMHLVEDKREGQWIRYFIAIENPVAKEILSVIRNQRAQFPVFTRDIEKLQERIDKGLMCKP